MNEREELEALRRLAELEARSRGAMTTPIDPILKESQSDPTRGMSTAQKYLAGAGKMMADVAMGGGQALGVVPQQDVDEQAKRDAPLMRTGAGKAGYLTSGLVTSLPTAAIPGINTVGGASLYGGLLGGLQPVPTGDSRAQNALAGAAGGALAQSAGNLIGRINRPVQSTLTPELQDLAAKAQQYGIPLDAADVTGSRPLKVIRSVFESMPLTADAQSGINEAKRQAFNRAALSEVGENASKATPDVMNAARTRIGSEFERLTANNKITLGNDFFDALVKVDASRNEFTSPSVSTAVNKGLELLARSEKQGKTISGADYQKIRSTLGKAADDAFGARNSELGQALKTIKRALDAEASNSLSAADKQAWQEASRQWQNLKILERASAPTSADAVAGNVSPAKLAQALMSADKQGFTYGTRGDAMSDLARIGQAFVKEQIPNSGTAERSFWQRMLENPVKAVWEGSVGGISRPVQMAINSPGGQRYLTTGIIPPSERAALIAELAKRGLVGGGVTAAPLIQSK